MKKTIADLEPLDHESLRRRYQLQKKHNQQDAVSKKAAEILNKVYERVEGGDASPLEIRVKIDNAPQSLIGMQCVDFVSAVLKRLEEKNCLAIAKPNVIDVREATICVPAFWAQPVASEPSESCWVESVAPETSTLQ